MSVKAAVMYVTTNHQASWVAGMVPISSHLKSSGHLEVVANHLLCRIIISPSPSKLATYYDNLAERSQLLAKVSNFNLSQIFLHQNLNRGKPCLKETKTKTKYLGPRRQWGPIYGSCTHGPIKLIMG